MFWYGVAWSVTRAQLDKVRWQGSGARLQQGSPSKEIQGQGNWQRCNMLGTELQDGVQGEWCQMM